MAPVHRKAARRVVARPARARTSEQRCEDYRRACRLLLLEPFDDLDSTMDRLLEVVATTLDVQRVSFWAYDEARDLIRCDHHFARKSAKALGPMVLRRSDCPSYFTALCKQLVIAAPDATKDKRTAELTDGYLKPFNVGALLDVPVRAFGRYVGVICHEVMGGPRAWTREDENFASQVAAQVALAFERDHARRAQAKLLERSLRDEETPLANRVALEEALAAYLQNPARSGALVITSVDQFAYLAGSLGRTRTLGLVRQFAARMQAAAPEHTLVARLAPNEFALLLRDVPARQIATAVEQWSAASKLPFESEGQRVFVTLSTGFDTIDTSTHSVETLLAEAHLANVAARKQGGDRIVTFTKAMRREMTDRVALEQDLRRALDAAEFDLELQPIVPLGKGGRLSLEALLRWRHPRHGVLSPDDFINVAIDAGIMLELGRRVLRAACDSIAKLRAKPGLAEAEITVNMSAPEILLPGTADAIRLELLRSGLPPHALTIEITETAFIVDLERAALAIGEIRALGVRISLDDFGTAYSSLSWLRRLPIDQVKIDRSFIAGIEHEERDLAIVRSIVELAKVFGQEVVAEGVENPKQLEKVRALDVDYAQGFYFAKPAALSELDLRKLRAMAGGSAPEQATA